MILQGDCIELMKGIKDESIDMILCDLPYGVTSCKWDVIIPFDKMWSQYNRIIKPNGVIALTAIQPFSSMLVMSNPKYFRYEMIWDKKKPTNFLNASRMPLRQHENILIFYKKLPTYNKIPYKRSTNNTFGKLNHHQCELYNTHLTGKHTDTGCPRTIINDIPVLNNLGVDKNGLHPTQKPIALFKYLIEMFTMEGEMILDTCAGSGTTGIAAMQANRKYILMEKESKYYEVIRSRLNV